MGAPRRKPVISSRKRVMDEGEEEDGSPARVIEEDSLSEGSIVSDADDDADGEGSDDSEIRSPSREEPLANGHHETRDASTKLSATSSVPAFSQVADDTEAMMNGLKISTDVELEEVSFDDIGGQQEVQAPTEGSGNHLKGNDVDRRRQEDEDYRKRRDADPAFVPNRGGFFMHDHRSAAPGYNGFRSFGRGGTRGRGGLRGTVPASNHSQPLSPADSLWSHDLHATLTEPIIKQTAPQPSNATIQIRQRIPVSSTSVQPPNRSFSKTTRLGEVQVRILLHGMTEPIIFSGVPRNTHTRLPHHRPPLRRDKPVRISIPEMGVRYIFPSVERSFIFIPRALRPNQQGFGRTRGRGSFGPNLGSFGPLSSRRTSGSAYSPSVAMSRRSSLAREISGTALSSPTNMMMPQQQGVPLKPGKPVVRLPPAVEQALQTPAPGDPLVNVPQLSTYPLPQKPAFHENRPEDLPMHHPKPERSLQVADIESPAAMEFNSHTTQQQPFHQQVPVQMATQAHPLVSMQFQHSRNQSHPSQASGNTPLPHIPEVAIHAQPFQPYPYPPPQSFYPQQYPSPMYFYPPPDQGMGSSATAPPFVPGQQYFYPLAVPPGPPPPIPMQSHTEVTTQPGTVAHEAGGMVYYYKPSDLTATTEGSSAYPPSHTTAPSTGMEPMMQPSYYPRPQGYYPPSR